MSSQEEFVQYKQMLHQQKSELLHNFQTNFQSAIPNGEALMSKLEDILNVMEALTTSIANHIHEANHLTSISFAVNQVQAQILDDVLHGVDDGALEAGLEVMEQLGLLLVDHLLVLDIFS
jgi:hypothetical protein